MQEGNGKQRHKRKQDVAEVEEDVAGVDPAQAAEALRPKTKKSPTTKKGRATTAPAKEEQQQATEEQLQAAEDQLPPPVAATATATVSTRPPAILAGKKIPMAQPQLQLHGPVGGGMQPPVELRGAPPYALESLVPGTYHRIMQILDPDPDVAATPACPMQVPRGTCPEFRKTGACSRTNNTCTRDHVCAVYVSPGRVGLVKMMSKSMKLNEQISRSMLAASRQQNIQRSAQMGARLDAKRERDMKLETDRQALERLKAGTAAYKDPIAAQALYLARQGLTPAIMQQYESQSQHRASVAAVALSQPRAYSLAPAHEGMAGGHRQASLSYLVRGDEEPDARNPRGGRAMPDPVGEAWGQEVHPALQRKPPAAQSAPVANPVQPASGPQKREREPFTQGDFHERHARLRAELEEEARIAEAEAEARKAEALARFAREEKRLEAEAKRSSYLQRKAAGKLQEIDDFEEHDE